MQIKQYLAEKKKQIDKELDKLLPKSSKGDSLVQAMRYSVFSGGKRLRPILTLEAAGLVGKKTKEAMTAGCAIEFIHTFSLIHDDLPCMDNDDYRRGKLTCHRQFGENVALLAGDALLNQAYTCLAGLCKKGNISKEIFVELVLEFSKAVGEKGLIGGQTEDLLLKNRRINPVRSPRQRRGIRHKTWRITSNGVNLEKLEKIYLQKTAALFILAVRNGAIIASANKKYLSSLSEFAKNFGLAFQIIDDCLDCKAEGTNYLNLMTPQAAKTRAKDYIRRAKDCLKIFGKRGERLNQIADFIVARKF